MKDYYGILGISPDATTEEVRAAFREQAKRLHPDYYRGDSQPFREAQEAWAVLGDTDARRSYDARGRSRPAAEATAASSHSADPLRPRRPPLPTDYIGSRPPAAAPPAGRATAVAETTIYLSPQTAASGGEVTLLLRLREVCTRCGGWSRWPGQGCELCAERGGARISALWQMRLPAGAHDGQLIDPGLAAEDGRRLLLRLRVVRQAARAVPGRRARR